MLPHHRFLGFATLTGVVLIGCLGFTLFFFLHPPAFTFEIKQAGLRFSIWSSETAHALRWVWFCLGIALSFTAFMLSRACVKLHPGQYPILARGLDVFAPLALLPLACVPLFLADFLPPILGTNLRFFLLLGLLALFLTRLFSPLLEPSALSAPEYAYRRQTVLIASIVLFISFSASAFGGYRFSKTVGEHVGDEGHYLIQAQSLYEDRNLDVTNQLMKWRGFEDPSQISFHRYHISHRSQGGSLYSVHPYGLSLLLAPSWKWGLGGRHIALGLISGIGLTGLFLLCRRMGTGNGASLIAVASLGTSVFWGIYAYRALPEVLAATLVIWTFWAIAVQQERPWLSLIIAAACCIYLPFAHTRFIPLSLMGIGLYGLFGLLGAEAWRGKLIRLALFTGVCLAGFGLYMAMQYAMFGASGNYPVRSFLFRYPMGAWEIFVSDRGLLSLFPVFFWLPGAMIGWCIVDRQNRLLCLGIMATFLAGLLTTATYPWYTGGSSLPGRYLVSVTPLLFVGVAVMLERVHLAARTWFLFLSLFSTLILIFIWIHLAGVGLEFIKPLHTLASFPLLQDLYFPHAPFRDGSDVNTLWVNIYALTTFLLSTAMILFQKKFFRVSFLGILLALSLGLTAQSQFDFDRFSLRTHTQQLHLEDNIFWLQRERDRRAWSQSREMRHFKSNTGGTEIEGRLSLKVARQGLDGPGELAWGWYPAIFPGNFNIKFTFAFASCDPGCLVATLDVAKNEGRSILTNEPIFCGDPESSRTMTIAADSFLLIEPRVHYHGCGDLVVNRIDVIEQFSGLGSLTKAE